MLILASNRVSYYIIHTIIATRKQRTPKLIQQHIKKLISEAFAIVNAINKRNGLTNTDMLKEADYEDQDVLKNLILDERLRELTFEGKRWYDLVRVALCTNTTKEVVDLVKAKLESSGNAVATKMTSMYSLSNPIYESELILNPLLKQHPVFERSSSTEKN
jgi:hypothetical protein